jgi:hypothetical protein
MKENVAIIQSDDHYCQINLSLKIAPVKYCSARTLGPGRAIGNSDFSPLAQLSLKNDAPLPFHSLSTDYVAIDVGDDLYSSYFYNICKI